MFLLGFIYQFKSILIGEIYWINLKFNFGLCIFLNIYFGLFLFLHELISLLGFCFIPIDSSKYSFIYKHSLGTEFNIEKFKKLFLIIIVRKKQKKNYLFNKDDFKNCFVNKIVQKS